MKPTIELSLRMQAVADFVTAGNRAADIGCDHGFVSIYLVQKQLSPHVIAMDINQGPLNIARDHIREYDMGQYIETRQSDGVYALKSGEADTMICAGMGGRLICRIMEEGSDVIRSMSEIILQPQSEVGYVRKFLREQGYHLRDENMILEDGKYYPILYLSVEDNKKIRGYETHLPQSVLDLYGPFLISNRNEVLRKYLLFQKQVYEKISEQLKNTEKQDKITEIDIAKEQIEMIFTEWRKTDEMQGSNGSTSEDCTSAVR